jgi:predicted alpha/beta-hydrolase family hydrolase
MARIFLGHGAWGTQAAMAPWVDGLAARGFEACAVALPRGHAHRASTAFLAQIPDEPGVIVGGQSYGGRAASIVAARDGAGETRRIHPLAGLVCFSYPLHRPGHPETAPERTAHWERIAAPSLLLSGERDPLARLPLLIAAVTALQDGELATWPRIGHSLADVREEALDRIAVFLRGLEAH